MRASLVVGWTSFYCSACGFWEVLALPGLRTRPMIGQNDPHGADLRMLHKPDLSDERIASSLHDEYGLKATAIAFLTLGADADTAVYRVHTDGGAMYFLKLRRRSAFVEATVEVPRILHDQGIAPVITPVATTTGRSWTSLEHFAVVLYPFVEGGNGLDVPLSDRQWIELGAALKRIHTAVLPLIVSRSIPRGRYSSRWRNRVRELQSWAMQSAATEQGAAS